MLISAPKTNSCKKNLYVSTVKEQQKFLLELGIMERLKSLSKNVSSAMAQKLVTEIKRLIDHDKMGTLLKLLQ